jgi:hypothetical protein
MGQMTLFDGEAAGALLGEGDGMLVRRGPIRMAPVAHSGDPVTSVLAADRHERSGARESNLRAVLEGDAAKDMDLLIGRVSGHRRALKEQGDGPGAETKPAGSRESTPREEIAWGKETNGVVASLRALKTNVQSGKPIECEIRGKVT